ncbi:MAG TPA: Asp-tRNA(Asn)/Glu-tRNA(Gln) amidotransferase subunit GatC [Spirochaetota bacterium]|jgi:aspartyl-tRNA(Asn)/glutamyl-tRNA(Gln) amidotransferase subunit C|nr:Asp-tRNA(Asn)/Glu-tRNA(Gln) amidotransferase subunit GatC [Spirochaetota bacterium]HPS85727.1 Asp-tRNA(Asn)/Glu-tRNA(Gln) amidotransferase subunit GatC [Spirochaetota bacterium]
MKIEEIDIIKVAKLARLDLSPEEKDEYSRQLSGIIEYVEKINELDTSMVEAADHIVELNNVFRKDAVKNSIDRSELEKIAPDFKEGYIIVPKIIE